MVFPCITITCAYNVAVCFGPRRMLNVGHGGVKYIVVVKGGPYYIRVWCVIWTMTVKNILAKYVHILNFFKEFLCLRKLLHLCLNKTYLGIIDTLSHFFIILNFP